MTPRYSSFSVDKISTIVFIHITKLNKISATVRSLVSLLGITVQSSSDVAPVSISYRWFHAQYKIQLGDGTGSSQCSSGDVKVSKRSASMNDFSHAPECLFSLNLCDCKTVFGFVELRF